MKKHGIKKKSSKAKKARKKGKPLRTFHKNNGLVTEKDLVGNLNEELREAWIKLRAFGASLGAQRIYASHNSIMFSKKICYFFVRPRKSFLEIWIFLPREVEGLKATRGTKKIEKYCNLFKLIHADQVEEPLTDWLREAYEFIPSITNQ
jgi:hypothetical protein